MGEIETIRDWSAGLRAFTNRNAGRRTVLSEDAPGTGAQEEESDYPFWGVSWDPRDGRVQIMLGEQGSVEKHLTRTIGSVRTIELLRGDEGRDEGLRVAHADGATLLRFVQAGGSMGRGV